MAKLSFLAGFGAGYVLGSKAGREWYEEIKRGYARAKDDPRLQSLAGMAQARADGVLNSAKARVGLGSSGDRSSAAGPGSVPRARSAPGTTPASDTPLPPPDTSGGL